MTDIEKVIEGFEMSYRYSNVDENNTLVPQQLVLDTLALLKGQASVEPIRDINGVYYCGNCSTICVGYESEFTNSIIKVESYCHKCGRKVKWE